METETVGLGTEVVVSQPPLGEREEPILTTAISCLWHSRRYVAAACLVGFIVAAGVAFTILPRYESTTRLMPPNRTETMGRSEEHTSELQSRGHLVCRILLEKK